MRFSAILVGLLAVAIFVAGCGGGSGTDASGSGASSSTATTGEAEGKGGEEGKGKEEGPAVNEEAASGGKKESEEKAKVTKEAEETNKKAKEAAANRSPFVKAGDQICKQVPRHYTEKLTALEKANGGKKLPTAEANLKAAVPPLYTAIKEFEEMSVSSSAEEEEVEALISAMEKAAHGLEANPKAPLSGKGSPFEEFQEITKEAGYVYCSSL